MVDTDVPVQVRDIFRDVFDDDSLDLRRSTTADDVPGWDSMKHLHLILTIERTLKIRLPSSKVGKLKNVGDLVDLVASVQ